MKFYKELLSSLFAIYLFGPSVAFTADKGPCAYRDVQGKQHVVATFMSVPARFRSKAICANATPSNLNTSNLANPEDVQIKGLGRSDTVSTDLGLMSVRWPRKAEELFGRTIQRALKDAAKAASRALHRGGFAPHVQAMNLDWKVVFLDENLPESQIPYQLISNCHPAWMTPPANLYVVSQRVVAGCSEGTVNVAHARADSQLVQTLIHEMGHAIENKILGGRMGNDRLRSEGFASWFEQYASDFSDVVSKQGGPRELYSRLAKIDFEASPFAFNFQGSARDYARASMYFAAIVKRYGVKGLMDVYQNIENGTPDFFTAIQARTGWDMKEASVQARQAADGH